MNEIIEVTVTWAKEGAIIPSYWLDDTGWQQPDFFNDPVIDNARIPELVNDSGEPLRVISLVSAGGGFLGAYTTSEAAVEPITWETLQPDLAGMAYARLKEPWISIEVDNILPSCGFLFHERSEGDLFGEYGCLEGWQDEIIKLAKSTIKDDEIDHHATVTLLIDVVAGDSHYDSWSGATEWDGPLVRAVSLLDFSKIEVTQ